MKRIRVLIPTYNEEENIQALVDAISKEFNDNLPNYDYYILFADNKSTDKTRDIIRNIAKENKRVRAIFNAKNFGQFNSPFHALLSGDDFDCTVQICADFQDPIELIHEFVKKWEQGNKVVVGVKSHSKEGKIIRFLRTIYYKLSKSWSDVEFIEHFTGFGLYDLSFINTLKQVDDPTPFMRGLVAEFASDIAIIEYLQPKRRAGKSHNNYKTLYDAAMLSFTTYTKEFPRLAGKLGMLLSGITFLGTIVLIILACVLPGFSPLYAVACGLAFFMSLLMFFIGMVGEYVMAINIRSLKRPLVIEEERINFDK